MGGGCQGERQQVDLGDRRLNFTNGKSKGLVSQAAENFDFEKMHLEWKNSEVDNIKMLAREQTNSSCCILLVGSCIGSTVLEGDLAIYF